MKTTTISPTVQSPNLNVLLNAYKSHSGNDQATADDLFSFLTFPGMERDTFLSVCCSCAVTVQGDIIYPVYSPL